MAYGGTLAFGLRHVYPIERDLKHVHDVLKGSDAVVYQSVRALRFEPMLYVYYDDSARNRPPSGVIVDQLPRFNDVYEDEEPISHILQAGQGGILVCQDGEEIFNEDSCYYSGQCCGHAETIEWVTPVTVFNRQKEAFVTYGNDPSLNWAYGDVCMIVRIGKSGDRLANPTVAQVKKAYQRVRD